MKFTAIRISCLALLFGFAGCASFTSTFSPDAKPDAKRAYLYARLTLTGEAGQGFCHLRAGLTVQEVDGTGSYDMEFDPEASMVAIPVRPGTYRLHSLLFARCDAYIAGERFIPASDAMGTAFTVEAGSAYYLADMTVQAGMSSNAVGLDKSGVGPDPQSEMTWQLTSATDNYYNSTLDFHARYPTLASLPTARTIRARP